MTCARIVLVCVLVVSALIVMAQSFDHAEIKPFVLIVITLTIAETILPIFQRTWRRPTHEPGQLG